MGKGHDGETKPSSDAQPTLEDVARRAGVSTATVSRVDQHARQGRRRRSSACRRAIAKTGYVPNLLAGGLASNRSRFVAALVPSIASSVFNDTMEAMSRALSEEGYLVMLALAG